MPNRHVESQLMIYSTMDGLNPANTEYHNSIDSLINTPLPDGITYSEYDVRLTNLMYFEYKEEENG